LWLALVNTVGGVRDTLLKDDGGNKKKTKKECRKKEGGWGGQGSRAKSGTISVWLKNPSCRLWGLCGASSRGRAKKKGNKMEIGCREVRKPDRRGGDLDLTSARTEAWKEETRGEHRDEREPPTSVKSEQDPRK